MFNLYITFIRSVIEFNFTELFSLRNLSSQYVSERILLIDNERKNIHGGYDITSLSYRI